MSFIDQAYYHQIKDLKFRSRGPFIDAIADLIKALVIEVNGPVSVRQVYYRAINAELIQSGDKGYRAVQGAIRDGRLIGSIAWNVIEDRNRQPLKPYYEKSIESALSHLAANYRLDRWQGQKFRIEVWLEQAALRDVVWPICHELGCVLVVCGGFTSHDSLFRGSERQRGYRGLGQTGIILHLSDLDPSGMQMPETIQDVLSALVDQPVHVQRLGLTATQAARYHLHGRPLKDGDTRAERYRKEHGDLAYELDGLPAIVLQDIVREGIETFIDWGVRDSVLVRELEDQRVIREIIQLAKGEDLL